MGRAFTVSRAKLIDLLWGVAWMFVAVAPLTADESPASNPPKTQATAGAHGRMTPEKYADYVRLFSAGDHRYASYYHPNVVFSALPAPHPLHGRQAILDLYDGLHKQLTEELTVTALAIDNEHGIMAAELNNRIVATADEVKLPSRILNKGDAMVGSGVVFYGLSNGLINCGLCVRRAAHHIAPTPVKSARRDSSHFTGAPSPLQV